MLLEPHEDVEIARRAAAHPGLAFARHAQLLPVVDPRGDRQGDVALLALAALAAAARAEPVDGLSCAAAARTRRDVHEPSEHGLLDLTHLTTAVALLARRDRRARLGPVTTAALAGLEPWHL